MFSNFAHLVYGKRLIYPSKIPVKHPIPRSICILKRTPTEAHLQNRETTLETKILSCPYSQCTRTYSRGRANVWKMSIYMRARWSIIEEEKNVHARVYNTHIHTSGARKAAAMILPLFSPSSASAREALKVSDG